MGTPAVTSRVTPAGTKLHDGYSTKVAFAADPDVSFWEKNAQPPGLDGGDAINQTTMHNTTVETMAAAALIKVTESKLTVAYDPKVYDQIFALINTNGAITVRFPNGDKLSFFGYLRTFEPQSLERGSQPEAQITIQPTNVDPADGSEALPDFVLSTGTGS